MKNLLLEEFKVWLEENNYGFVTTPLNTKHSAMFHVWNAAIKIGFDRGVSAVKKC
ncbi:MAG: hypothetical protein JKX72_02475 [Robiginitomaculum sp.]|nr:hypothetical protein [Robiginitomaculum sp.]